MKIVGSMAARKLKFGKVLFLILFCKFCGIGIFMKGFFPLKINSPGFSSRNANGTKVGSKFDRLVVVMIDALRADFVFNNRSYMTFTKHLIDRGYTFSFQAHSNPPTVTMPRIKALTTGTIPGFIDVILNVDSKELLEDNLITQMKAARKKIIFFGDDTWMRLFPDHFKRADGTTSFFVTDYTEVDDNVTRHLKHETERSDWDVMILHYLGLDHIGHLAGPFSPLVQPKLTEMDSIIRMIYDTAIKQDQLRNITTLIVLCGDHGMSDVGSHGGSSFAETTTPLVFVSSLFQQGKGKAYQGLNVNQIDIAPTLSLLMGLSIPKNNIGILIPELFSHHSPDQFLEALRMNSIQISDVFTSNTKQDTVLELETALRLHDEWLEDFAKGSYLRIVLDSRAVKISNMYSSAMRVMTSKLIESMSSYDDYALRIGIFLLLQSLFGTFFVKLHCAGKDLSPFLFLQSSTGLIVFVVASTFTASVHVHICSMQSSGNSELLCTTSSALSLTLSVIFVMCTALTVTLVVYLLSNIKETVLFVHNWVLLETEKSQTSIFLLLGLLLHNISLLSTSFIEEEHQTWYFLTTTYHLILLILEYTKDKYVSSSHSSVPNKSINFKRTTGQDMVQPGADYASCGNSCYGSTKDQSHGDIDPNSFSRKPLFMILILLSCDRILRGWNQTGIKWADQPDIGDWLVKPQNKTILSFLLLIVLLIMAMKTFLEWKNRFVVPLVFTTGACSVYIYRAVTGSVNLLPWGSPYQPQQGIHFAQLVHSSVFVLILMALYQFLKSSYESTENKARSEDDIPPGQLCLVGYLLLLLLLLRPHNTPLVALTVLQAHIHHRYIWKTCRSNLEIILSAHYIGWFTYFAQGNSNSLATVDISAGYIGLDQNYSPVFVAVLTSLATFSGPLFWMINAVLFLKMRGQSTSCLESAVHDVCTIVLLIISSNVAICAIMCWLNCYHLFVWSVFSPKLLYEGVISVVFGLVILALSILN